MHSAEWIKIAVTALAMTKCFLSSLFTLHLLREICGISETIYINTRFMWNTLNNPISLFCVSVFYMSVWGLFIQELLSRNANLRGHFTYRSSCDCSICERIKQTPLEIISNQEYSTTDQLILMDTSYMTTGLTHILCQCHQIYNFWCQHWKYWTSWTVHPQMRVQSSQTRPWTAAPARDTTFSFSF